MKKLSLLFLGVVLLLPNFLQAQDEFYDPFNLYEVVKDSGWDSAKLSAYFREMTLDLYGIIPEVLEIGDDMADADLLDANGNTKHIADYLGKHFILFFGTSGCPGWEQTLYAAKEVLETCSDKVTIIYVNMDDDATWKESMVTHDTPWINLRDPDFEAIRKEMRAMDGIPLHLRNRSSISGLSAAYGVITFPAFVMISPEGKIVDKGLGAGCVKKFVENIK